MVEIGENFKFGQNFRKILIFIETSRCRPKYLKISIFLIEVKSFEMYLDFGQNWEKWQFWSKYLQISILIKIFKISLFRSKLSKNPHFGENFRKISILVKFSKNLNWCQTFEKSRFSSKFSKNRDFSPKSLKYSVLVKFWSKLSKISICKTFLNRAILVKIRGNFNFGHNFRKTSILFETSRFRSKYPKILILVKIFWKSWLMPKFSKYLDFVQN